ncbi:hypothetical protein HYPSUDRAFT_1073943 [Hypholoma sublateritium FD-334 SS-4]|uniref:Reverse transcriptase zinc-binding domain-containing protein n=1 Tax=Hypholoma sublateritium (strain FD-334 SS-4) TaxID=945553 RepID=A0A0D2P0R0_HYPSF|nr:hypothetical protein HYPSUDRAFT_1073943 [Hypholoma sublateritium FD-334 SS-4]
MQIRAGHVPLNEYLAWFGQSDTPRCDLCWSLRRVYKTDSLHHFLFVCPSYDGYRTDMDFAHGRDARNLPKILANQKHLDALLTYIGRTKRLRTRPGKVLLSSLSALQQS